MNYSKKILFLGFTPRGTGYFDVMEEEATYLKKLGYDVMIAFCDKNRKNNYQLHVPHKKILVDKIPVLFKHPKADCTFDKLSSVEFKLYQAQIKRGVEKIVHDFNPDIIISNHIWTISYEVSKLNIPYIMWGHGTDIARIQNNDPDWKRFKSYADTALIGAKKVLFPSRAVQDKFLQTYPEYLNKTMVIHHGYNNEIFYPEHICDRKPKLGAIQLVTVGAVDKSKGLHTIIKAMKKLGDNYHLTWVGSSPNLEDIVAKGYPNITFIGQQPHTKVAEELRKGDIGILASEGVFEAFGLSALQYMGCGLPIILSNMPCFHEFTTDEFREFFKPGNVDDLVDKIKSMTSRLERQDNQSGYLSYKKSCEFLWDKHNIKLLDIINNI